MFFSRWLIQTLLNITRHLWKVRIIFFSLTLSAPSCCEEGIQQQIKAETSNHNFHFRGEAVHCHGANRGSAAGWTFKLAEGEAATVHRGQNLAYFHTGNKSYYYHLWEINLYFVVTVRVSAVEVIKGPCCYEMLKYFIRMSFCLNSAFLHSFSKDTAN